MFAQVSPVLNVNKCSRSFQVLKIYVVKDPKYRNIIPVFLYLYTVSLLPSVDDDMVLHVGHVQTTIDNLEVELSIYQDDTPLYPTSLSVTAIL